MDVPDNTKTGEKGVNYAEDVFNRIRQDYLDFAADLDTGELTFIPISALNGDNVVHPSTNMPWYDGRH